MMNSPAFGDNQYSGDKGLTGDEHKTIVKFCIDHDLKIGEFLLQAGLYCVKKKIISKKKDK